jgi:hypothetical protein
MISCQINKTFLDHIASVLIKHDGLVVKFSDYKNAPMEKIIQFRKRQYFARELDYLCSDVNEENECKYRIDERSQHFWIEINSEIVGTLRATPYPFELMEVGKYFREIGDAYQKHVEFGRLIIDSKRSKKVSAYKLMASAFLYSFLPPCLLKLSNLVKLPKRYMRFTWSKLFITPAIMRATKH